MLSVLLSAVVEAVLSGFLLLTSIYFFLAYLPYTFYALIAAPPYPWLIAFASFHHLLSVAMIAALWFLTRPERSTRSAKLVFVAGATLLCVLAFGKLLLHARNDSSSLLLAYIALLPPISIALMRFAPAADAADVDRPLPDWSYFAAAATGALVALASAMGAAYDRTPSHRGNLPWLMGWSFLTHILLALIVVSVFNAVRAVSRNKPNAAFRNRNGVITLAILAGGVFLSRFLSASFTVHAAIAYSYGLLVSCALFGCAASLILQSQKLRKARAHRTAAWTAVFALVAVLVAMPWALRDEDWNFVLHRALALLVWIGIFGVVFTRISRPVLLRSLGRSVLFALIFACGFGVAYGSRILWSRSLGATEDDITVALERYADGDASFRLAFDIMTAAKSTGCGELCTILRLHTNLRATADRDLEIVSQLQPTPGPKPNIFIFVLDSVRPDYLGAYNPAVDFTPRLDQFARESLVFHNAFTPYAGTTMAEPAIWAGALLLHAHYLQPFGRVNSLEKLAQANDYEMYVSWDTVLRVLLQDSPRLHRLDDHANQWNQVEICSTLDQLKTQLSNRRYSSPVFFYSQPMNVHQFADNPLPTQRQAGWKKRPGFSARISLELNQADTCFGVFVDYLKAKGMYENSIVILVSDHGDATGELGRTGHSVIVYPEVMRIPFIVHLPSGWQDKYVFDTTRVTALTDIAPSLYYLLGQHPIRHHPLIGRPIFTATRKELDSYQRPDLLLASDIEATYGILDEGRYFYATYDMPERSYLYDLQSDPLGERDILTPALKTKYDRRIVQYLQQIDGFYGYRPPLGTWFASK